jgi:N-acetylglucosamine kinase-like BadF-type ATPase
MAHASPAPKRSAVLAVDGGNSKTDVVLAVDGGNSKTDVALVAGDGSVLATAHGPTCSHQQVGIEAGMAQLAALVERAAAKAGLPGDARPVADVGVYGLAGADFPSDVHLLRDGLAGQALAATDVVLNDTFIALRAGTRRPWGVALICGQGVNACAVAPDGRSARFDGVGDISGDWGGGGGLGSAALAAAVRGRDGRGKRTALERLVPEHFGLRSPGAVTRALYFDRLSDRRLSELAPIVFRAATQGDMVARDIVDRLADELVAMARALIRRLRLSRLDPDVVLAGGVFRTDETGFHARLEAGVHAAAPAARLVRLTAPPVLGAALLGLDRVAGGTTDPAVEERLRRRLDARPSMDDA